LDDVNDLGWILAPDESACFIAPTNCNSATSQLIPRTGEFEGEAYSFLECPLCSTGYFWKNITNATNGVCTSCETIDPDDGPDDPYCSYCTNDGLCQQCSIGVRRNLQDDLNHEVDVFPEYNKLSCTTPISDCDVINIPDNYGVYLEKFFCK